MNIEKVRLFNSLFQTKTQKYNNSNNSSMKQHTLLIAFLVGTLVVSTAFADVYMHNMRGSNDRNCERNVNRNNGNRLFDSQNNAKGGYACPRAVGGQAAAAQTPNMYYYVGEKIPLEWTNQHGGGDNKNLHSEVVLQYACTDTLDPTGQFNAADGTVGTPRDGIPQDGNDAATDQIPDNVDSATPGTQATKRFGMHESFANYQECQRTERNKGLFTSDQNLNRNDARATRQNNNGNRNGLECPEERDYYPYWRPSPWRDIAVITSDYSAEKLKYYQDNSQNVATNARGMCVAGASAQAQADFTQKRQQRDWYNNEAQCNSNGHTWTATQYAPDFNGPPSPPMEVVQGEYSRVNQLGNGAAAFTKVTTDANCGPNSDQVCMKEICTDHSTVRTYAALKTNGDSNCPAGQSTKTFKTWDGRMFDAHFGNSLGATSFPFAIPNTPNQNCVLRLRYNITTYDYPAWENGNRYLSDATTPKFTGAPGIDSTANCRGDNANNDQPCTAYSFPAMTQDPYVKVGENNEILSLALNTNQYSRTFQDRSYVFEIRARPADIPATQSIVSMSVRGKRGNIVQTYPAVEYDFAPNQLTLGTGDQVHAQWTGSDYNPQRGCNNGEGGPPDCQGCAPFSQQAINAANQNSRADRANLVFTDAVGYNAPLGAKPTDTVDLLETSLTAQENIAKTPFSGADVWKLAYINQDAADSPLKAAGLNCLTQTELNNINNNNQRENHPQNCAKLNAAVKPYFDGGLMNAARKGKFAGMSTRNNNFSNRDMRMNICVKDALTSPTDKACTPESAGEVPEQRHFAGLQAKTRSAPQPPSNPVAPIDPQDPATPNPDATIAPIEKDNDAVGDGEKEACEARILNFLMQIGLWGIIAISIAMIMIGALGTILIQRVYDRHKKGRPERNEWMDKGGEQI